MNDLQMDISRELSPTPELLDSTLIDLTTLNRLTLDQLQDSISAAGMNVRRLSLQADTIDIPQSLLRYRLADLAVSGVKILASR